MTLEELTDDKVEKILSFTIAACRITQSKRQQQVAAEVANEWALSGDRPVPLPRIAKHLGFSVREVGHSAAALVRLGVLQATEPNTVTPCVEIGEASQKRRRHAA